MDHLIYLYTVPGGTRDLGHPQIPTVIEDGKEDPTV